MTQQVGIVNGDVLEKLGSVGFILGAILFGISGFLMPRAASPTSDLKEMLKPLGEYQFRTILASLLMAIGFWVVVVGVASVYSSITSSGSAWARLGFYITLIGTALWTVSLSLDIASASAVANWLSASADSKEVAWGVVAALSAFGRGMVPITWIIYWLGLTLLGVSMIQSNVYPLWLGWIASIVSIPTIVLGIFQTFNARSITLTLIFSILMLLTTLWCLAVGIWVARKVW